MKDHVNCKRCGGQGMLKVKSPLTGKWVVIDCYRCQGWGVEPDALKALDSSD